MAALGWLLNLGYAASGSGAPAVPAVPVVKRRDSGGRDTTRKKRNFLIQDDLYDQRIKTAVEKPDSVYAPVEPELIPPQKKRIVAKITDIRPANSHILTDEDVELVLLLLDELDKVA